jgi:hypothetical protein
MKKLLLLSLLAMFAIACNNSGSSNSESGSSSERYGIKSGILIYKNSMMGMEVKITQYFKEYGEIEATITEMEMMGQKNKQISLRKDGYYYSYSEGQKEGAKFKIDVNDSTSNKKLTEETILKEGGKKVGSEDVLGKECTVYEIPGESGQSKLWVWKNMMLKMVAQQDQMEITMEATELKETSDFPEGVFDLPADINFKEMTDQQQDFEDPNAEG